MNSGRTVFSQLIGFLPDREFRRCVSRSSARVLVLGSVSDDGLRPVDVPRKLAGHRSLPSFAARQTLPPGFRSRVARSTLADANESRDGHRTPVVRARSDRGRSGAQSVRAGFDHHRPLPLVVSLGAIPPAQGRRQIAHAAGSAREQTRNGRWTSCTTRWSAGGRSGC